MRQAAVAELIMTDVEKFECRVEHDLTGARLFSGPESVTEYSCPVLSDVVVKHRDGGDAGAKNPPVTTSVVRVRV